MPEEREYFLDGKEIPNVDEYFVSTKLHYLDILLNTLILDKIIKSTFQAPQSGALFRLTTFII